MAKIAALLAGASDPRSTLLAQQTLLLTRIQRLHDMVAALEKEIQEMDNGTPLTGAQKLEVFGAAYDPAWEAEAEQRWGHTHAWQQSQARTRRMTKSDWQAVKQAQEQLLARQGQAKRDGIAPDSAAGMALAEEHRQQVGQFYDCAHQMHRSLGAMFVQDERFAATFNTVEPGLAQWVCDAIAANADAHDAPPLDSCAWQTSAE